MTVLDKLACNQGRRDEIPNQELARELVETGNKEGISEIVENLWNKDKKVQSDCIKTLYEIGDLRPELISDYVLAFLKLLTSRNSRLVWGAMMALSTIAEIKAQEIYEQLDRVYDAMKEGSVITVDHGVRVLARVAAKDKDYGEKIFPYLLNHLKICRPKEVPQHGESILAAVNARNKEAYLTMLKERESYMTSTQMGRIKKIYKAVEKL